MSKSARKRSAQKRHRLLPLKGRPNARPLSYKPEETKRSSKQSRVIAMLQSPAGATIAAMMKATGWQQHSVRGFLAGVVRKRLKLKLGSKKVDGNRVYQIAAQWRAELHLANPNAGQPEFNAARKDRSGAAGPRKTRGRDRALARSRRRRTSQPLAHRVRAAAAPSPAPASPVSDPGLPAAGGSVR